MPWLCFIACRSCTKSSVAWGGSSWGCPTANEAASKQLPIAYCVLASGYYLLPIVCCLFPPPYSPHRCQLGARAPRRTQRTSHRTWSLSLGFGSPENHYGNLLLDMDQCGNNRQQKNMLNWEAKRSGAANTVTSGARGVSKQLGPKSEPKPRRPPRKFNIRCSPVWPQTIPNMLLGKQSAPVQRIPSFPGPERSRGN